MNRNYYVKNGVGRNLAVYVLVVPFKTKQRVKRIDFFLLYSNKLLFKTFIKY